MKKQWLLAVLLMSVAALSSRAIADDNRVEVWGRKITYSCAYYSSTQVDLAIKLSQDVAPGTRVQLHVGFGGYEWIGGGSSRRLLWTDIVDLDPTWVDGNNFWFDLSKTIGQRSSSRNLESAQYVFKLTQRNGDVWWLKGNRSAMGYYNVDFYQMQSGCVSSEQPPQEKTNLVWTSVQQN
jgi:hypothetical protein